MSAIFVTGRSQDLVVNDAAILLQMVSVREKGQRDREDFCNLLMIEPEWVWIGYESEERGDNIAGADGHAIVQFSDNLHVFSFQSYLFFSFPERGVEKAGVTRVADSPRKTDLPFVEA